VVEISQGFPLRLPHSQWAPGMDFGLFFYLKLKQESTGQVENLPEEYPPVTLR
jgi:hypothetical protein